MTKDDLSRLEQHRILRFEPSEGITWIRLTHDLLTEVVSTGRRQRREREERAEADAVAAEERKKRKKKRVLIYSAFAFARSRCPKHALATAGDASKREASRLVTQMHLGRAERMLEKDDPAGAFLLFDQALGTDPDKESTARHRLRLGVAWRQMPRLKELLHFEKLSRAELCAGRRIHCRQRPERRPHLAPGSRKAAAEQGSHHRVAKYPGLPFILTRKNSCLSQPPAQQMRLSKPLGPSGKGAKSRCGTSKPANPKAPCVLWTRGTARKALVQPGRQRPVLVVSDLDDGKKSRVEIWNFQTGNMEAEPLLNEWPVNWAAFSRDGRFVVIAAGESQDGTEGHAVVWDWRDGRTTLLQRRRRAGRLRRVQRGWNQRCSPQMASVKALWAERASGVIPTRHRNTRDAWHSGVLLALFSHEGAATRAHFSPDGRWIATASRDSTVRLWHVGTQKEVLKIKHDGDVNDVAFSPDGRYLVSGGRDRGARIWEVATGQLLGSPFWHSETVVEVAFSPDGRTILTSSKHLARIWDVGLNGPKAAQLKVGGSVALAAVSADGARLVTISDKGQPRSALRKAVADCLRPVFGSAAARRCGACSCVAINADGSSVAVASYDPDSQAFTLQIYEGGGRRQ